jgi:hypothetical protein
MPAPLPPFLPGDPEEFSEHVASHGTEWYEYCRLAYEYIQKTESTVNEATQRAERSEAQFLELQREFTALEQRREREITELRAVQQYQKEQLHEKEQQYMKAAMERDQARRLAAPTVNTPVSTPVHEPVAEKPVVAPVGAPASITTPSSEAAGLSERLPDPDKFEGDRKDLRRFIAQIQEKMNVNLDRFPTPQSRMAYVNNRLKGAPYAQILPYIRKGICTLNDYQDILDILERAFGDPNRVNNARNELFSLRQTNKEFGTFFAEFQRLALEGEMPEETLSTLLEQAISRELRSMLMHNQPPSREYHQFARFLQELENRRRQYTTNQPPVIKTYAVTARPAQRPQSPQSPGPVAAKSTEQPWRPTVQRNEHTSAQQYDPMDLGTTRRPMRRGYSPSRRETGACFRCGSLEHRIRDCPYPDTRQRVQIMASYEPRPESPQRGRIPESRSPSPSQTSSVKGVSLE